MEEFNTIQRIVDLCQARGWTVYRLAKESGITYSTLCTMLNKSAAPSLHTLGRICNAFGLTFAQFFALDTLAAALPPEDMAFLEQWRALSRENRLAVQKYIGFLLTQK